VRKEAKSPGAEWEKLVKLDECCTLLAERERKKERERERERERGVPHDRKTSSLDN